MNHTVITVFLDKENKIMNLEQKQISYFELHKSFTGTKHQEPITFINKYTVDQPTQTELSHQQVPIWSA